MIGLELEVMVRPNGSCQICIFAEIRNHYKPTVGGGQKVTANLL